MRKHSIFLMLTLSMLFFPAATAATITALPTALNPAHLEQTSSYARILRYNEENNTLTVELIVPDSLMTTYTRFRSATASLPTDAKCRSKPSKSMIWAFIPSTRMQTVTLLFS